MNRTFTCIAVLGMALVAVGVCLGYTIEFRGSLDNWMIAVLFTLEGIAAGVIIASGVSLVRKRFARQKRRVSRRPVGAIVRA